MESIFFKLEKPLKVRLIAFILFFLWCLSLFEQDSPISKKVLLLIIPALLLGYAASYEIRKDFKNKKIISFFGIPVIKVKQLIPFPEYISVFSASFKQNNYWNSVSALGTKAKFDSFVVRFFEGSNNFTVLKTNDYNEALKQANLLSEMLEVEIYNSVNK